MEARFMVEEELLAGEVAEQFVEVAFAIGGVVG
jgi:hypothetical protein